MEKFIKIQLIKEYLLTNNIGIEEFAKLCGLKTYTMKKVLKDDPSIKPTTLYKIADVMQVKIIDLLYEL